jgi:hypothetical protein
MKNLSFLQISTAFTLFLWLFGHQTQAQQLICPSPFAASAANGQPFSESWNEGLSVGTKYIPTVVHLIGDASSLTFNQVKSAIDRLNADFIDPNGTHTIVFVLATIGNKGQCTDGITRHPNILQNSTNYKDLTGWPNEKYFNIWVLSNPEVLGAVTESPSKFSDENGALLRIDRVAGQNGAFDQTDGLSINTSEIYPNTTGGHTLTHETGHWLNLLHVFAPCEDISGAPFPNVWNCCHDANEGTTQGDFIADTPSQGFFATANPADCNQTIAACNGASVVSQENFMSYGGPCIKSFTNGQRDWMTYCLDNFRPDIWSTENLRCTGVTSESNPIIFTGQNITWNTSRSITGTLIIESGAILTIQSGVMVQFCDAGKIIVKQGGRLNLYGTISSSCVGRMWQGVEVWGTKSQNQLNQIAAQGQFWGYSGAVVEHARTGVLLNNSADATGNSTGGVLVCEGVSFLNNARSVQYEPYENKFPNNQIGSNRGRFTACSFEVNNDYRGDDTDFYEPIDIILFRSFADLKGVRGISFRGCKFHNMRDENELVLETFYGFGIVAAEAGFSVTDYCAGPASPTYPPPPCAPNFTVTSSFKNLFVGITAGNTDIDGTKPYSFQVDKTLFEGNWRGIQSTAGSRAIITRNTFKLGKVPPNVSSVQSITGLILNDTHTSFTVEENNFFRDPAISQDVADGWELTGILAASIGEFNNLIRKNYFTDLKVGNASIGDNATPDGDKGLLYLCNENTGNDNFDFLIETPNSLNAARIKAVQAYVDPNDPTGANRPAGNFFSLTGPTGSDSDFRNRFFITYVHGPTILETPIYFNTDYFFPDLENQSRACESIFCPPPCRTDGEIAAIRQQIDQDALSRDSLNTLLLIGGTDQAVTNARKKRRDFLAYRVQVNVAEVSKHLAYAEAADNAAFRDAMAKANAYDADLALANDYIGSAEIGNYSALMNGLTAKYQLTGMVLNEFNAYRAITDMMAQHYTNGGNKYNLSTLQIEWLKGQADNSPYVRSRGMARRILRIYGYYYPVDYGTNAEERGMNIAQGVKPNLFSIYPNPANNQVTIHIETGKTTPETAQVHILRGDGTLWQERLFSITESGNVVFDVQSLPQGIYLVQVRLSTGEVETKRIAIVH